MKKVIFLFLTFTILAVLLFISYRMFFLSSNAKGALQVTSFPESTVFLNGKEIGKTPMCICGTDAEVNPTHASNVQKAFQTETQDNLIPVGEYTVRLVPTDTKFSEFQEKITIGQSVLTVVDRKFGQGAESEGSVITLEPTGKSGAELLVLSVPDASVVLLNNERIGTSPITQQELTQSDHELLLRKSGYTDKAVRIKTAKGYKLIAKIYLGVNPRAVTGREEQKTASDSADTNKESEDENVLTVAQVRILFTGTGFLRVRGGPSLADSEVGRVTPQETYPLVSEEDEWFQIEYEEGKLGWVTKQYAERVED